MKARYLVPILLVAAACGPRTPSGPNLLLVTVDTLREDAVGCYGAADALTPEWDRLAKEGVLFANAQSQVPITLPSHATIFTGLYPGAHGSRHNGIPLADERVTLAERLQNAGYQTAAFLGSQVLNRAFHVDQGFTIYRDRWDPAEGSMGLHGLWERPANRVTDAFLDWFATRDKERPFFAWVHFYDPHAPADPPAPFAAAAGGGYAGEAAFADRELGRVIAAIEKEGLMDGTVVAVLSDHGEGLGQHGETEHGLLLYQTTLAVPWVMRLPGGPRGRIVTAPVETVDLLPTLAALLPIESVAGGPGRNLLPLLDGSSPESPERPLYAESFYGNIGYRWAPLYAVRRGAWKLVRGSRDELFDLAVDPAETTDRAREHPDLVAELGAALEGIEAEETAEANAGEVLTDEQRQMLEGLGYVAPKGPAGDAADLPDPRDRFVAHEKIIRAREFQAEGRPDSARAELLGALRVDPENTDAMLRLAPYYHEAGETAKEEALYRRILAVDPHHAPAWSNLGILKEIEGDAAGALECYDRAIVADSLFPDAYANRGNARFSEGDLDGAMADYDRALRLRPEYAAPHFGRAMVYQRRGDLEALVRELRLALRIDPNLQEARDWLRALEAQQQGY